MATFESVKMEGAIAIDKARAVFHHAVRHLRRHLSDHESSKAFFAKLQETHHALECLSKTHREIVTNGRCVPPTDRHASEQENQGHRQVSKNDVLDNVDVFKLLNTVASQQETFLTSLKNVDEAMKKQVAAVDLSFDCIAKLERKVATFDELATNKANGSVIVSSSLSRQVAVPSDNGQTITETRTSSRSMNPIIACEPCVRQEQDNPGDRQVSKNDTVGSLDVFKLFHSVASQQESFRDSLKTVDEAMKQQIAAVNSSFACIESLERKVSSLSVLVENRTDAGVNSSPLSNRSVAAQNEEGQKSKDAFSSSRLSNPSDCCVSTQLQDVEMLETTLPPESSPSMHEHDVPGTDDGVSDVNNDGPRVEEHCRERDYGQLLAYSMELDRAIDVAVQQLGIPRADLSRNTIFEEMLRNKYLPPGDLTANREAIMDRIQETIADAIDFRASLKAPDCVECLSSSMSGDASDDHIQETCLRGNSDIQVGQGERIKLRGLEPKDRSAVYNAVIEALQDEFEWDTQVSSMAIMRYFQEIKLITVPRTDPNYSRVFNIISDVLEELRWGGP